MSSGQVLALMLFAAFCGGSLGNLYRLALKAPSWLFQD